MIPIRTKIRASVRGDAPASVLSVISDGDDQWIEYRGTRFGSWLAARGISHGWCLRASVEWITDEVRARGTRVLISEATILTPANVAALSAALPGVTIIHLLHGSPAWCASQSPELVYSAIRQARDLPNVHIGTVSDPGAMAWLPGTKVIHIPNPIEIPAFLQTKNEELGTRNEDTLCVSLIARPSPVKNWSGMIAALGLLAARRPISALVIGRPTPNHTQHRAYLEDLGIDCQFHEFQSWEETLALVASRVDVGLACGFSDALNLIAAEHCLLGIPVVGSPVMPWLPKSWQVNPQDPAAMADLIERHVDSPQSGAVGKRIVTRMARANEAILTKNLSNLLLAA